MTAGDITLNIGTGEGNMGRGKGGGNWGAAFTDVIQLHCFSLERWAGGPFVMTVLRCKMVRCFATRHLSQY